MVRNPGDPLACIWLIPQIATDISVFVAQVGLKESPDFHLDPNYINTNSQQYKKQRQTWMKFDNFDELWIHSARQFSASAYFAQYDLYNEKL